MKILGMRFFTHFFNYCNTFATGNLRGAAVLGDNMYLVGDDNRVWRCSVETWADWTDLEGVTAFWDAYSDGSAVYLAAEHEAGARLYRLEIAAPGGFTCGTNPPRFVGGALRCG